MRQIARRGVRLPEESGDQNKGAEIHRVLAALPNIILSDSSSHISSIGNRLISLLMPIEWQELLGLGPVDVKADILAQMIMTHMYANIFIREIYLLLNIAIHSAICLVNHTQLAVQMGGNCKCSAGFSQMTSDYIVSR